MVEIVRGLRYRNSGDKIFGRPARPMPERIRPATTRNSARRKTAPRSHRREALMLHASHRMVQGAEPPPACVNFKRRRAAEAQDRRVLEKRYRGKRKSTRFACSTP